jgi:hypothetical protein
MRRLGRLGALAVASAAVLAGVALLSSSPRSRITRENVDRIREGMSRQEVEAILGTPRDSSTGPVLLERGDGRGPAGFFVPDGCESYGPDGSAFLRWTDDLGTATVCFERDGRAWAPFFQPLKKVQQSPLNNLLWRTKRLWRKWFP